MTGIFFGSTTGTTESVANQIAQELGISSTDIHNVSARFMELFGPGVFQPATVELLSSEDGTNFTSQGIIPTTISNKDPELSFQEYLFQGDWKARYVRLKADEANKGFIFVDEIVVW